MASKQEQLNVPDELEWPDLGRVIRQRRTRRDFGMLSSAQLNAFLWWSCRVTATGDRFLGFPLTQRPAPSAGAIHPIHVCLSRSGEDWWRYDPEAHALAAIVGAEHALCGFRAAAAEVVSPQEGTLLLFIAEPGKTHAKYRDAESLIWRDTGVLLGHMALLAEGLTLNFCPLGVTGEPWATRLDQQHKLVGVGAAILGSRG
jgi:SagB-type dehydrogenase family enzyme